MQSASLDSLESARPLLTGWGLRDAERGWRNLAGIAAALGPDEWPALAEPFTKATIRGSGGDRATTTTLLRAGPCGPQ
jgi:hypothetical protein